MDINYLFRRQQIETMRAHGAACSGSRVAHQQMADLYAARISLYRGRAAQVVG